VARLGEILIARGVVSPDGLRAALEACRRNGGRLGTWLVRLGFVNENVLLEALAEQTGCPSVTANALATAPTDLRGLIPAALARRHLAVAFSRQGRRIDVAMINPNDLVLVDEIGSVTRHTVRPYVATESALMAALSVPTSPHLEASAPPPLRGATTGVREWRQFWRLESSPTELFRALEAAALAPPALTGATFPALTPIGAERPGVGFTAPKELTEALAASNHRDQVATCALDYLQNFATRLALFSLHHNKVMGWAGRGPQLVEDDFHNLILPLDRPSLFLNLSRGVDLHVGPVSGGEGNQLLFDALGPPEPKEAVVAPVKVRGKTAAFLWLDRGEAGVAEVPVALVREVARVLGLTLEVLVIRRKIKTESNLTEGSPGD
jgi:hypothetical protein